MHHLVFEDNKGGFTDFNGNEVKAGDQIIYGPDQRTGIMDEALHDGDAFVTFDDGSRETVKWRHLVKLCH